MKRVGRSEVSAITQIPASGPCALVTTPPMSRALILTDGAEAGRCCALAGGAAPSNWRIPTAATPAQSLLVIVRLPSPVTRVACSATAFGPRISRIAVPVATENGIHRTCRVCLRGEIILGGETRLAGPAFPRHSLGSEN